MINTVHLKDVPTGNVIWTPTGKEFNPLNMVTDNVDPRDICHGLSRLYMFGGMSRSAMTLAEFSVILHEYVVAEFREIVVLAEQVNKTKFDEASHLSLKTMRWLSMMYYAPFVYLSPLPMLDFNQKVHYGRILSCILKYFDVYDKRYKGALFLLDVAVDHLKRDYYVNDYRRKCDHLDSTEAQQEWGRLYKRLSGDQALFRSDGSISYR